jgi:hypothetical protein
VRAVVRRQKNPHWTPAQEKDIERAERLGTKATMLELGVAEFLKTHMPCIGEIAVARELLGTVLEFREEAAAIHKRLEPKPRKKAVKGAGK